MRFNAPGMVVKTGKWLLCCEPNSPIWGSQHPADPGLIIACSHYGELYKSENAGDSWSKIGREFTEIRAVSWTPN